MCVHGQGRQTSPERALRRERGLCVHFQVRGKAHSVHATGVYRHLGSRTAVSGSLHPEFNARLAAMREDLAKLAPRFFRFSAASVSSKLHAAKAILFAKGLHLCGTWPALSATETKRLHHSVMKVYARCCLGALNADPWPQQAFRALHAQHGITAPVHLVLQARLLLLNRLLQKGPVDVIALLAASQPARRFWWAAVQADMAIVTAHADVDLLRASSFEEQLLAIKSNPKRFRKELCAVVASPAFSETKVWATKHKLAESLQSWRCDVCDKVCATKQGLAVHKFRAHMCVRATRWKFDCTHCPVCLQEFWGRSRLLAHVKEKSPRCRHVLMTYQDLPEAVIAGVEEQEAAVARSLRARGLKRVAAELPVVTLQGPLTLQAVGVGVCHSTRLKTQTKKFWG